MSLDDGACGVCAGAAGSLVGVPAPTMKKLSMWYVVPVEFTQSEERSIVIESS
jgi:hypothetical protein